MKINRLKEQEVSDIIEKESVDLSSFKVKDTLNPKIFNEKDHMYPEVRTRLLMIADDFFETQKSSEKTLFFTTFSLCRVLLVFYECSTFFLRYPAKVSREFRMLLTCRALVVHVGR